MDQTEKAGSKWPTLKPEQQLEILNRYRANCHKGDADHQMFAEDFFCRAVVEEDLVDVYLDYERRREQSRLTLSPQ